MLTAGGPIKNARDILRYSLPINNGPIREVQKTLESISDLLRIPGWWLKGWGGEGLGWRGWGYRSGSMCSERREGGEGRRAAVRSWLVRGMTFWDGTEAAVVSASIRGWVAALHFP